jgi:RND family efflux transporter MFP subunit
LENRYRQAQNALKQAQTSLGDFNITSRVDGKVYSVLKEAGELINAQQALAQVGHADRFIIDMSIDEVDIARLRIGQKVWVSLDAYEGQVYEALISRILPLKDERTQTFSVEALFTDSPDVLYAGLSGEANIVISKKENVLSIPLDLLIEDSKVLTNDGEVEVQTGLRNLEYVEILSGIDSTTILYRPE